VQNDCDTGYGMKGTPYAGRGMEMRQDHQSSAYHKDERTTDLDISKQGDGIRGQGESNGSDRLSGNDSRGVSWDDYQGSVPRTCSSGIGWVARSIYRIAAAGGVEKRND